ncbi:MAG TPA: acyl-CoA dehydrogenase, partial [Anaerolineae bacterium]|nr:acyl-CoA dehydrogenase [Anaerolineae bacterium]
MDFELTEEQRMIRDLARDFAQNEIAPIAARIDETGEFPHETIKQMGELGLMGLEAPEEYGGAGADTVSYVLAVEEISKVCATHGAIMSVNNSLVCYGINEFGTEEQKRRFLVPLASGQALGAYALTE